MANITLGGNPVSTNGELPDVGSALPSLTVVGDDMAAFDVGSIEGPLVLNIFPSVETGTCSTAVRTFNERAAGLDGVTVVCISADLPMAQGRFCGAEGIENVTMASVFRHPETAETLGVRFLDGKFEGLCARAVVVTDADHNIVHTQLVAEVADEPDYDAALSALA